MKEEIQAVGHHIVVLAPEKVESTSTSGIIVPPKDNGEPIEVSVVSVGEEVARILTGDKVLVTPDAGVDFKRDGVTYKAITDAVVLAIIR